MIGRDRYQALTLWHPRFTTYRESNSVAGGKASEAKIKLAERRQRAITLRKAGASFRAIATQIAREFENPKYDESQAARDCYHSLNELSALSVEQAEAMRQLESERYDLVLMAIARQVQAGDLQAIDRWLKTVRHRCELWGLSLPPAERPKQEGGPTGIELEIITGEH
jgi:hypothetical protein